MKHISILITHQALIAAIGNTHYIFSMVNDFLRGSGEEARFALNMVGLSKEMELNGGLYTVKSDVVVNDVKKTDLVIIPPMSGSMKKAVAKNKGYIPWINQQYEKGAEVASLCVGAFLLAETGLLKGKKCSTHWQTAQDFEERFPDIQLMDEEIITDYDGLYTSGGANSYWNLLVYLVEKFTSRAMAIRVSKYFEVEIDRDNQSQFRIFKGIKRHGDERVRQAQEYIETHYSNKLTIEELAEGSHLSRRTFQRRFKKATHYSVGEYMQRIRVEAAKKDFETSQKTIEEVKYSAGYKDSAAFREVFKKFSGLTPVEYRNKYNKATDG
jgi:transcriptional regulator GlxA family with amidase domain